MFNWYQNLLFREIFGDYRSLPFYIQFNLSPNWTVSICILSVEFEFGKYKSGPERSELVGQLKQSIRKRSTPIETFCGPWTFTTLNFKQFMHFLYTFSKDEIQQRFAGSFAMKMLKLNGTVCLRYSTGPPFNSSQKLISRLRGKHNSFYVGLHEPSDQIRAIRFCLTQTL